MWKQEASQQGLFLARVVQAGWDCRASSAQCPPRLFFLFYVSPLCLFIHKGRSYLQSVSCKAFSIQRGPRWNGIIPPSCWAAGCLVMVCKFLFWHPHHPGLPGSLSLRFNEVKVLGLPFPSQRPTLAWCLSLLPQDMWESKRLHRHPFLGTRRATGLGVSAGKWPPTLSYWRAWESQWGSSGQRWSPDGPGGWDSGTHPAFSRTDGTSSPENQPRREGASASTKARGTQGEREGLAAHSGNIRLWLVSLFLAFPSLSQVQGGGRLEQQYSHPSSNSNSNTEAEHSPWHGCFQQDRAGTAAPWSH